MQIWKEPYPQVLSTVGRDIRAFFAGCVAFTLDESVFIQTPYASWHCSMASDNMPFSNSSIAKGGSASAGIHVLLDSVWPSQST